MKVLVFEKPAQARTICSALPHKNHKTHIEIKPCDFFSQGATAVWCIGALVQVAPPEKQNEAWAEWSLDHLPMLPESLKYEVIKEKSKQFKIVKDYLKQATEIINCGDPGRQGELLVMQCVNLSGCSKKKILRFWCPSLTPKAVLQNLKNLQPGEKYKPKYYEALAREHSDYIIGMNASRAFTLLMQNKEVSGVFSAGRVQSALLSIIRRRELEIENFRPTSFWEIYGNFISNGTPYKGKLQNDSNNRFLCINHANDVLRALHGGKAAVKSLDNTKKETQPPELHNLSSLMSLLNRTHKIAPDEVLSTCQALYERGILSYPRTSSKHVTPAEAADFPIILENLKSIDMYKDLVKITDISSSKRFVDATKVDDHYAIIPTEKTPQLNDLSKNELIVYDTVARSLIAAHYGPYIFNQSTLITSVKEFDFKTTGNQELVKGWKLVIPDKNDKESNNEEEEPTQSVPKLTVGQEVEVADTDLHEGTTKPPHQYTEGNLIALMEKLNLGQESTRAATITLLKSRKYTAIKKNKVIVTDKGKIMYEAIKATPIGSEQLTSKWEEFLKKIGTTNTNEAIKLYNYFVKRSKELATLLVKQAIENQDKWDIREFLTSMQEELEEEKKGLGPCPNCGNPVYERDKFYGCGAFASNGCKFSQNKKILGKNLSPSNMKKLLSGKKTGLIKGMKKGEKEFNAYLSYESGTLKFSFEKQTKKQK
ncbi:DNA topoisomerase III [Bacillus sp. AFS054943]|uniref:type IA DNA topoisomerase n=1 Tax=Bacillus sp. AFS054943 TaxID=2033506 RepID=UPI000BFD76BD|nr:type IA DNA topoisomerase [Bacillus sp. AFS054943]PGL85652.1 DNA topoisomerase III [Bacillus sp. AFS054943]